MVDAFVRHLPADLPPNSGILEIDVYLDGPAVRRACTWAIVRGLLTSRHAILLDAMHEMARQVAPFAAHDARTIQHLDHDVQAAEQVAGRKRVPDTLRRNAHA